MPQLDIATFFSQYIWLCVFYIGFYLVLVHYYLPKLARILKVRNSFGTSNNVANDALYEIVTREDLAVTRFKYAQGALRQGFAHVGTWVDNTAKHINNAAKTNKQFIKLIATKARQEALIQKDIKTLRSAFFNKFPQSEVKNSTKVFSTFYSKALLTVLK